MRVFKLFREMHQVRPEGLENSRGESAPMSFLRVDSKTDPVVNWARMTLGESSGYVMLRLDHPRDSPRDTCPGDSEVIQGYAKYLGIFLDFEILGIS